MRSVGILTLALLLTTSPPLHSQFIDPLDAEFTELDAKLDTQFIQQDMLLEQRFQQVKQAVENAYKGLTDKIVVNWHSDIQMPDAQSWTTYDDSFTSRAKFDFSRGVYQVETLVEQDVSNSLLKLKAFAAQIASSNSTQLRQADVFEQTLQQELQQSGYVPAMFEQPDVTLDPYTEVSKLLAKDTATLIAAVDLSQVQSQSPSVAPAVDNTPSGTQRQSETLDNNTSDTLVSTNNSAQEQAAGSDTLSSLSSDPSDSIPGSSAVSLVLASEANVTKLVLTIPFINRYQQNLFESKLDIVKKLAQQYQLDVSLILAVIETESSFNPLAISPIPAFGLMQLVPNTAGIDAYQYLYGERHIVSPEYLFDQHNNLLLGTTYLHLLSQRYLRDIEDKQSKLYCILASYNTGVGNVARTFVAQKNLKLAIAKINSLAPEQIYQQLMANLPAEETKQYLLKVLARKQKYASFDL